LYIPDIEPGLALKSLARFADRIAVTTPGTRAYLGKHRSVIVTGYPTRPGLRSWSRERAFNVLGLSTDVPVLLVFGGSKGARSINQATWAVLADLLPDMQVVHITGKLDWPAVDEVRQRLSASLPEKLQARYHPYAFLQDEIGAAFMAADLAVCRAGASTLGELPLFGLPAVLVPYPHAWQYQQVNAQYLAERGAAAIVPDADLPGQYLSVVRDLMQNPPKRERMRAAMLMLAQPGAAAKIAEQLYDLAAGVRREP
jgi:UDP-N-acetylglucosamine--N-acetylmuramyl-(pentapeptide) pyrophosphoryl-undecaprenol N-acetylglucosamine transferase